MLPNTRQEMRILVNAYPLTLDWVKVRIRVMVAITVTVRVTATVTATVRVRVRVRVTMRTYFHARQGCQACVLMRVASGLGGGGSVLVAAPGSVHSTFFELQLLMPHHHIHIPPRPLLFRHYSPTKNKHKGRIAI